MQPFSLRWKKRNKSGAIGIIGGANGPTAIFARRISKRRRVREAAEQEAFLSRAAAIIQPTGHPFAEIGEFLTTRYGAVPYLLEPYKLESIKANVVMNRFRHLLPEAPTLSAHPTKAELVAYGAHCDLAFQKARAMDADALGLVFKAWRLPQFGEAVVECEMTTEYLCIAQGPDAAESLMEEITLWRGVSAEEIAARSPHFLVYATTLKKRGEL